TSQMQAGLLIFRPGRQCLLLEALTRLLAVKILANSLSHQIVRGSASGLRERTQTLLLRLVELDGYRHRYLLVLPFDTYPNPDPCHGPGEIDGGASPAPPLAPVAAGPLGSLALRHRRLDAEGDAEPVPQIDDPDQRRQVDGLHLGEMAPDFLIERVRGAGIG